MATIRKNATKKIAEILASAVLVKQYRYDDMGDTCGTVTPEQVLAAGREYEFDRIYTDDGVTRLCIHRNWSFTAFATVEAAKRHLTPQAFAKYFPAAA